MCDGAKPNRKFLQGLGCKSEGVIYKTVNRYCRERNIFFISDVPHLMKTTRNCWYSSSSGGVRYMWVSLCSGCVDPVIIFLFLYSFFLLSQNNGKHILWEHLHYLYHHTQAESGLYIGRRLTNEHLHLTSYSKMKVNLAAQVLCLIYDHCTQ